MAGMTPPGGNYGQDPFIDLMMGGMSKGKGPRPGGGYGGSTNKGGGGIDPGMFDLSYPHGSAGAMESPTGRNDPAYRALLEKYSGAPPWVKQMVMERYWQNVMNGGQKAGPPMRQG